MISTLVSVWRILDDGMRRRLLTLPGLLLVGGLLEGISVGLFLPLLQVIATPDDIKTLPWVSDFYRASGVASTLAFLLLLLGTILVVFILKNAFALYLTYYQQKFVWSSRSSVSETLLRYYLSAPYVFHLRHNSAILLRNVTQTVQEVFAGIILPLVMLIAEGIVILIICLLLIGIDPAVTATVASILGVTLGGYYLLVRNSLKRWGQITQRTQKSMIQHVQQSLSGIREIKVLGCESYFSDLFAREIELNSNSRLRYQVVSQLSKHLIEIAVVAIMSATLLLTILSGRPLAEAIPTLGLFAVAAFRLMPSLNRMAGQMQNLRFGSAALDVLHEDLTNARKTFGDARNSNPASPPLSFEIALALDNISFRYPGGSVDILENISLTIRRGESVAFVGASGAGKSTLAAIIMGLLAPTSGTMRVDGKGVSTETIRSWQRHLGFIPQEVAILDDTLKHNIAFGIPAVEIDPRRLERAVRDAALGDVVASLSDGYETLLGERGTRLSGGQRQRVGIARVLYLDADVLVLDEATSALDAETESEVSGAIKALHGTKTLLIIAHRLSTVQNCDRIYFMESGRIVDQGTFAELKARNVSFRSMADKMTLGKTS